MSLLCFYNDFVTPTFKLLFFYIPQLTVPDQKVIVGVLNVVV